MKALWSDSDSNRRQFFRNYAAIYDKSLPQDAETILVTDDSGNLCGLAGILDRDYSAEIVFLAIDKKYRRQGYGSYLLNEMENTLRVSRIDTARAILPINEELNGFFSKAGYDLFDGKKEYAFPFAVLHYCERYRKLIENKAPVKARALKTLSLEDQLLLKAFINKNNVTKAASYNNVLSSVIIDGNRICAYLLCEALHGGVVIDSLYAEKEHPEYIPDCIRVLNQELAKRKEKLKDLKLSFTDNNGKAVKLLEYFTDGLMEPEEIIRETIAVKKLF